MTVTLASVPGLPVDPEAVRDGAAALQRAGSRLELDVDSVLLRWRTLPGAYRAPEAPDLMTSVQRLRPAATAVAAGVRLVSRALDDFADELDALSRERAALRDDIADHHRRHSTSPTPRAGEPGPDLAPAADAADDLRQRCTALAAQIDAAAEACVRALRRVPDPAAPLPTAPAAEAHGVRSPSPSIADAVGLTLLDRLAEDGGVHAAAMLSAHADWSALLRESAISPEAVATWWRALAPATAATLSAAIPALIGNLDGVDIATRVAANRTRAAQHVAHLTAERRELEAVRPSRGRSQAADARVEQTTREIAYFASVARGDTHLYGWDPDRGALIEMTGDPARATAALFVVPGTNTDMHLFMDPRPVTRFAQWQVRSARADVVAFTVLTGPMPSLDPAVAASGGPQINRIARARGIEYAAFVRGVGSVEPDLWTMSYEHSYGGAVASAAEAHGGVVDTRFMAASVGAVGPYDVAAGTTYFAAQAPDDINRYYAGLRSGPLGFDVPPESFPGVTVVPTGLPGVDPLTVWTAGLPGSLSGPLLIRDSVDHHVALMSDDEDVNGKVLSAVRALLKQAGGSR